MKNYVCLFLAFIMLCGIVSPAFAFDEFPETGAAPHAHCYPEGDPIYPGFLQLSTDPIVLVYYDSLFDELELLMDMDTNELNDYINDRIAYLTNTFDEELINMECTGPVTEMEPDVVSAKFIIKTMWMAAAIIVIRHGYTCSGTLVLRSLAGIDYSETSGTGLFAKKIGPTSVYRDHIVLIKTNKRNLGVMYSGVFSRSINDDLYFSLRKTNIITTKNAGKYTTVFSDRYDFHLDFMGSLFATLVNDWAWLCIHTDVLNAINVNINLYTV